MKKVISSSVLMLIMLLTGILLFTPKVSAASEKKAIVTVNMNGGKLGDSRKIVHYGYIYAGELSGDGECFSGNGYEYPYRKGYAFAGFSYDKKGKKSVKSEEQAYKKASKKKNGKITIYARWKKKCIKVTFVPGKNKLLDFRNQKYTNKSISVYIQKGKVVGSGIASYPFQYAGDYMVEWYTDKALTHKVNLWSYKPKKNDKLYAKYIYN